VSLYSVFVVIFFRPTESQQNFIAIPAFRDFGDRIFVDVLEILKKYKSVK